MTALLRTLMPLIALLAGCASAPIDPVAQRAALVRDLSAERIRADMLALASDEMEGRFTGTAGYERAAALVAERLRSLGLRAVGSGDPAQPHYQRVDFVESRVASAALQLQTRAGEQPLAFPADFVVSGGFGAAQDGLASAPLVFAGHGIAAPELGHDDYAGLQVKDRVLVLIGGAPATFGISERAVYSALDGKQQQALARGAKGLLLVQAPADRLRSPWSQTQRFAGLPALRWRHAEGRVQDGFAELPTASLSPAAAERLFDAQGLKLDEVIARYAAGEQPGFALTGAAVSLQRRSLQGRLSAPNVLGLLPGSDPALRHELVLVSAHLDHLGTREAGPADRIYNGAYDNAAGVAVVLELARLLAAAPPAQRPKRSLLFVAFTGEEQGLRGSDFLAHHPPVPGSRVVANLNIDMPYLGHALQDMQGYGAQHSGFEALLAQAAAENGLTVSPDPRPELVRLIRSDQFAFVRRGIPGINLKPGTRSAMPGVDGAAVQQDYLTRHYHQVSDDAQLPFNPEAARQYGRTAATLALLLANAAHAPVWKEGDFFGKRFGAGAAARP